MNIVKYYKRRADGQVEVAMVKVKQSSPARMAELRVRGFHKIGDCIRSTDKIMLGRGFTRERLKPDVPDFKPSRMARSVHAAARAMGLAPLR